MNPQTVQKLREQTPEFRELIGYLAKKANEINTLEGLNDFPLKERTFELGVRTEVHKRIKEILEPLLLDNPQVEAADPAEYLVV